LPPARDMTSLRPKRRGNAFRTVFSFTGDHWRRQPVRLSVIIAAVLASTAADVLTPLYSGRLVDAVARGAASEELAWDAAIAAFSMLIALSTGAIVLRHIAFMGIIDLTMKMMADIASDAFSRVQRFSTDWHANSFAGSTVRKVTRGMWALDLLNDTILVALLPSAVMLLGSTLLLGWYWPMMGVIVGVGSLIYIAITVSLSLWYVAPAASLANAWDTKLGGSLADAVSCNSVVKAFGAETREEGRLAQVVAKWRSRTRRTWVRGTINGTAQGVTMLVLRIAVIGFAIMLWSQGRAGAGDIAFVLTSFFVLQGYLRDVGMHVRNVQRSVNDMEEMVDLHAQSLGVVDVPDAPAIVVEEGRIVFDDVTFHYGGHETAALRDFSLAIEAGERVGLVGHSGSGKTTFVKLIQRLYDVNGGADLHRRAGCRTRPNQSLRSQIAIVQQEPILFHRSWPKTSPMRGPVRAGRDRARRRSSPSAHEFIAGCRKGYATLVGERGVKLSGGERQRVALARAFLADAPILILDEATSSLDSESEALIQQAMDRLMKGPHRRSSSRTACRPCARSTGCYPCLRQGPHNIGTTPPVTNRRGMDARVSLRFAPVARE
jgi:ATP-binding cassette subfamily B protein